MPMFKKQMAVVLAIAVIAIVGTMFFESDRDEIVRLDDGVAKSTELNIDRDSERDLNRESVSRASNGKIFVYVTGAVNNPGMIELVGSELRISDAINASGGLLPTADVDSINMADKISDGQHIRVPEKNIPRSISDPSIDNASARSEKGGTTGDIVNINTAGLEELDTLPGIGPAMAQRIIDYRELNGAFKSIDEIQNVRGIGPKKFENMKNRLKI